MTHFEVKTAVRNPFRERHAFYQRLLHTPFENETGNVGDWVGVWLGEMKSRTALGQLQKLGLTCDTYKISPEKLAKMSSLEARGFIVRVKEDLEKEGNRTGTIENRLKCLRSWFLFNNIQVGKMPRVEGKSSKYGEGNEPVPSPEDLKLVLNEANLRAKAVISLIAFAGVRLGVVGNYKGKNGLKISDFPEMKIESKQVIFGKTPTLVRVRKELSKTESGYLTFLNAEGVGHLKNYLDWRLRNEKLGSDSPVVTAGTQRASHGSFIITKNIGEVIKNAMEKANLNHRPYIWRRYFFERLHNAVTENKLDRDFLTFMGGHRGNMDIVYTSLSKGAIDEKTLERMREQYRDASALCLETSVKSIMKEVEQRQKEIEQKQFEREIEIIGNERESQLLIAGYTREEIEKLDEGPGDPIVDMSLEDLAKLVQTKLEQRFGKKTNGNGNHQKVVNAKEAKKLINQGWTFLGKLADDEFIVKEPNDQ